MNENQENPANLLVQTAMALLQGEAQEEQFNQLLTERLNGLNEARKDFRQKTHLMHEEVNEANEELQAKSRLMHERFKEMEPELQKIEQGFSAYETALLNLSKYRENQDRQIIETNLPLLQESAQQLIQALDEFDQTFWQKGPTNFPIFNQLLNSLKGVKEGYLPLEVLESSLDVIMENFLGMKMSMEQVNFEQSQPVREELPKLLELFEAMDRITAEIRSFLADPENQVLKDYEPELLEIAEQFARIQANLMEALEQEARKECIKCHYVNPIDAIHCRQCGARLPSDEAQAAEIMQGEVAMAPGGTIISENLQKIQEGVKQIKDGIITPQEFATLLDWMETQLKQAEEELPRKPILESDTLPDAQEDPELALNQQHFIDTIDSLMKSGMEKINAGLQEMRLFLHDGIQTHLDNGLNILWHGAGEISLVQQLTTHQEQENV